MDDKGLVFLGAQDAIQKPKAGRLLLPENTPLAHAGVDQQAESQGQIRLVRKVLDHLRPAVFEHIEIVFAEHGDNVSLLVADGGEYVHDFYVA